MNKVIKYNVMWGSDCGALVREVEKGLAEGWELYGSICSGAEVIDGINIPVICQAMVKYELG